MTNQSKKKFTTRDVADICQVNKSTVIDWIRENKITAFRLPAGHYRFEEEEVTRFRQSLETK